MAKELIERGQIAGCLKRGGGKFYFDPARMILTPGAKDYLREKSIEIVYGRCPETSDVEARTGEKEDLVKTIATLLGRDYGISDPSQVAEVTRRVLARMETR